MYNSWPSEKEDEWPGWRVTGSPSSENLKQGLGAALISQMGLWMDLGGADREVTLKKAKTICSRH